MLNFLIILNLSYLYPLIISEEDRQGKR